MRQSEFRLEYASYDDELELSRIVLQGSGAEFVTLTEVLDGLVVPWLKACGYQFESLDIVHKEHECRCTHGTATDADVI